MLTGDQGEPAASMRRLTSTMSWRALVVAVVAVGLGVLGPPAFAAPKLVVAGGFEAKFVPGAPMPVVVKISGDRPVQGTLTVRTDSNRSSLSVDVPGSVKEFLVILPDTSDVD